MSPPDSKNIPETPPLPIKEVIEKSVQYIIKNGTSFEEKLRQNDANGQFEFLSPENTHYSYYKYRLEAASGNEGKSENQNLLFGEKSGNTEIAKPRELLFLTDLPPISDHDLEIIKATAIYVACNSSKHQEGFHKYMERKGRRNQFAFMNKTHTLHGLFQQYTKQYRAIISKCQQNAAENNSAKLIDSYISEEDQNTFFQKAYERAAFEKRHKIKEKTREQDERNKQIHYASIDWQDFTFAKKINFDAVDEVSELPVPISRESVVYRALDTKTKDLEFVNVPVKESENTESKSKPDLNDEAQSAKPVPANVPKGMKIKAAGESRLKRKANEQSTSEVGTIRCPITGQLVPESEFDTHLKTLLRDPRYKEQQENFMRKNFTYSSNLTTDQVYDNIKRLVRTGRQSEEEEAVAAKRINLGK